MSNAKRSAERSFSEDLQNDGFSIFAGKDGEGASDTTVTVTDAESINGLIEWFRHRPPASSDLATIAFRKALAESIEQKIPTLMIQTTRFRVNFLFIPPLVFLETRKSPADAWREASWESRKEDVELREWAMSQIVANYKRSLLQPERPDGSDE